MIKFLMMIVIVLLPTCESLAGIDGELDNFFNSMGYNSNVTKGGAYQDQSGGYYTGGRLYARAPSRSIDIFNLQAPSIKTGCGGIDMFMGGMSHIKAEDFIRAMKSIGSGAAGYLMSLALQTQTPQIYNTLQKMNDIAREVNNMNITSCEAAANVVGGIWPRSDASSRYLCNAMGSKNSMFDDWAQARQGCGAEGKRDSVMSAKNGEFKDILGNEFNLVWKAIVKNGFLAKDSELAEIFMSISGSIISRKVGNGENSSIQQIHLASLANDQDLIDVLIFGTSRNGNVAKIYKCDNRSEDKCLNPSRKTLSISDNKALINKVEDIMLSISEKMRVYDEKGLSEIELGFINSTRVPILTIIKVHNAFKAGSSIINITEFSEAIAYDLVLQFIEGVLETVNHSIKELEKVQVDGKMIAEFKQDIRDARTQIYERRNGVYQQLHHTLSVIQKTKLVEGQLQHMFSSYMTMED